MLLASVCLEIENTFITYLMPVSMLYIKKSQGRPNTLFVTLDPNRNIQSFMKHIEIRLNYILGHNLEMLDFNDSMWVLLDLNYLARLFFRSVPTEKVDIQNQLNQYSCMRLSIFIYSNKSLHQGLKKISKFKIPDCPWVSTVFAWRPGEEVHQINYNWFKKQSLISE